jgi:hypothetical protein
MKKHYKVKKVNITKLKSYLAIKPTKNKINDKRQHTSSSR